MENWKDQMKVEYAQLKDQSVRQFRFSGNPCIHPLSSPHLILSALTPGAGLVA